LSSAGSSSHASGGRPRLGLPPLACGATAEVLEVGLRALGQREVLRGLVVLGRGVVERGRGRLGVHRGLARRGLLARGDLAHDGRALLGLRLVGNVLVPVLLPVPLLAGVHAQMLIGLLPGGRRRGRPGTRQGGVGLLLALLALGALVGH
jgi:hypothetical protein